MWAQLGSQRNRVHEREFLLMAVNGTLLRHLGMVWSKLRFQSVWWRAAVCCVCTYAAMLPFPGWLKGVRFVIVFVVCYYIKVCFKTNETVSAALWTRLHAWPVWECAHVHEYMSISDRVPLLNLWKKVRQMVVSRLKTGERVSKLQMHTRAQTKAYANLINTNIKLTLVKSPSEKQPQTICSPSLTPFAQTKASHHCAFLKWEYRPSTVDLEYEPGI